jgi:hypothetical protein
VKSDKRTEEWIWDDRRGIRPLPEQRVVLEEMIVSKSSVSNDEALHEEGVVLHHIDQAGIGVDDDLVGKARIALAVKRFFACKPFAEGPVPVHERQTDRGIGIEHLFGADHFQLDWIEIEAKLALGNRPQTLEYPVKVIKRPFLMRTDEKIVGNGRAHAGTSVSVFGEKSWRKTG